MTTPIISVDEWIIGNVSVQHETPALITSAVNYKETALSRGLHRLLIDFEVVLPTASESNKFESLLLQIQGRANPFILDLGSDTNWTNPMSQSFNLTLAAAAGINTTVLKVTESRDVPLGAKFQFGNHHKIYTVIDSDRTEQTVTVYPSMRYQQVVGTNLNFKNPRVLLRLKDDKTAAIKYGYRNTVYKISAYEVME